MIVIVLLYHTEKREEVNVKRERREEREVEK